MQLVLALVFVCAVFASPLLAKDQSDAARRVMGSVDRVIDILKSGDYKDPTQKTALREKLEPVVRDIFDFRELSMRTVGALLERIHAGAAGRIRRGLRPTAGGNLSGQNPKIH